METFELAIPLAIQEAIVYIGIRGRLLALAGDCFMDRTAKVRFQGHLSQHMPLENGTPQGEILSPALLNILMSGINTPP